MHSGGLGIRMKIWKYGLLPFVAGLSWIAFGATANIDPNVYLDDVKFLASPELKGRATGSPELEKAGAFIAAKFREFGMKPADGKGYYQAFPVTTDARLGKANRFHFAEAGRTTVLHFPEDFVPLNFSSPGKLSGPVVFPATGGSSFMVAISVFIIHSLLSVNDRTSLFAGLYTVLSNCSNAALILLIACSCLAMASSLASSVASFAASFMTSSREYPGSLRLPVSLYLFSLSRTAVFHSSRLLYVNVTL